MYFWDKLDEDVKRGSIKNSATSKPDIRYLDFTISNKCNQLVYIVILCKHRLDQRWKETKQRSTRLLGTSKDRLPRCNRYEVS